MKTTPRRAIKLIESLNRMLYGLIFLWTPWQSRTVQSQFVHNNLTGTKMKLMLKLRGRATKTRKTTTKSRVSVTGSQSLRSDGRASKTFSRKALCSESSAGRWSGETPSQKLRIRCHQSRKSFSCSVATMDSPTVKSRTYSCHRNIFKSEGQITQLNPFNSNLKKHIE